MRPGRRSARSAVGLSDAGSVLLAVAVVAGAWTPSAVHPAWPLAAVAIALMRRRPVLLVVAAAFVASSLAARSLAGMGPVAPASFDGTVTLVSDPAPTRYGVRADVRVDGRRLELSASGGAAGSLSSALAGERLAVKGRVRPPPPHAPWLVPRHVVGRLTATSIERVDSGAAPWRASNRIRRLIARGADGLAPQSRSLYLAFVVGDDRDLRPEIVDDFRGSGLTHVLVVSGQNLAFVIALLGPLLRRLRLGARTAVAVAVIGAFATVTRFEPSVLRASAMATVAVTAAFAGRPASAARRLALAIAVLVLVDPLLVRAVGFQLSVAACVGITGLGAPVARRLRGPAAVREAVGASIAAQVGVAPVLIHQFGGVPVAGVVANPLAVPVAGLVTTWGLPAGAAAGLVGPGLGRWLHLPTTILVSWVATVARVSAAVPLGEVRALEAWALAFLGAVWLVLTRRVVELPAVGLASPRRPRAQPAARLAAVACVLVLLVPAVGLRWPPPVERPLEGVTVSRVESATTVEVRGRADPGRVMEALRRCGVRRIDLLRLDGPGDPDLIGALRHRWSVARIEHL